MMKALLLLVLLHLASVLGASGDDLWKSESKKNWEPGVIRTDSNKPAEEKGVHLVLVPGCDPAFKSTQSKYYPRKKNKPKVYVDNDQSFPPDNDLKNKKVKITIVAHGIREILPSTDYSYGVKYSIAGKSPEELAAIIKTFVE